MKHCYIKGLLAALPLSVMLLSQAGAASFEEFRMAGGGFANPAVAYLMKAPPTFYSIHGHWPANWSEVRESGLVQADLRNSDGMLVNPDDGSFDFAGDIQYVYEPGATAPRILLGENSAIDLLPREMTYESMFDSLKVSSNAGVADIYNRNELQTLLGMQEMAMQGINLFTSVKGRAPYAWMEVEQAGLAPFRCGDLNPATGGLLKLDGSALDLAFAYHPNFNASNVRAMRATNIPLWDGSAL